MTKEDNRNEGFGSKEIPSAASACSFYRQVEEQLQAEYLKLGIHTAAVNTALNSLTLL